MATTVARLQAILAADTGQFDKAMGQSQTKMQKVGKVAGVAGLAIAGGLAVGLKSSVGAAKDAQVAQVTLAQALNAGGISQAKYGAEIEKNIQKTSKLAALDDEDLSNAFAKLVRTTGDVTKATEGMNLAADIARSRNISLETATKAVERAYNGNAAALKRVGIAVPTVSDATEALKAHQDRLKDSLKGTTGATRERIEAEIQALKHTREAAKASDRQATAQNALEEAQRKFAGSAEQYGKTGAAAQERFSVAVENLQESLGKLLLPAITKVSNAFADLASFLEEHRGLTKVLVIGLGALAAALIAVSVATKLMTLAFLASPIGLVTLAIAGLVAGLVVAYQRSETFRDIVQGALRAVTAAGEVLADVFRWFRDHSGTILAVLSHHPAWLALKLAFNIIVTVGEKALDVFRFLREHAGTILNVLSKHPAWLVLKTAVENVAEAFNAIKSAIEWVRDNAASILGKVSGVLGKIPGLGDAGDPFFRPPDVGAIAGATGMDSTINQALWNELGMARAFGLQLTSGYRPGAITRSGTPSDHGQFPSKAIDVAGPASAMAAFFKSLIGNRGVKQAFYDPLGSIFGGALSGYREGGHSDHVHVATYDQGGYLRPGWNLAYNGTGRPEAVGGAPMMLAVNIGGQHVADVLFDPLRRAAQVFERRNGRPAFGGV